MIGSDVVALCDQASVCVWCCATWSLSVIVTLDWFALLLKWKREQSSRNTLTWWSECVHVCSVSHRVNSAQSTAYLRRHGMTYISTFSKFRPATCIQLEWAHDGIIEIDTVLIGTSRLQPTQIHFSLYTPRGCSCFQVISSKHKWDLSFQRALNRF